MKKKTINEPIINIVLRYAEKTFTKEFLDSTSDSWYLDSIFWFEGEYKCTKAQRGQLPLPKGRGLLGKYNEISFSLGLVRSAVNRKYKFEDK